jgi:hypothetical protein
MNIGDHIPTTWQGDWPTPFLRFSEDVVPGINGKTRLEDAWDSENARIVTFRLVETAGEKDAEIRRIHAMQGTTVRVVDQFNINRGDCIILQASAVGSMFVGGKWEVTAVWTIAPQVIVPEGWKDSVQ